MELSVSSSHIDSCRVCYLSIPLARTLIYVYYIVQMMFIKKYVLQHLPKCIKTEWESN